MKVFTQNVGRWPSPPSFFSLVGDAALETERDYDPFHKSSRVSARTRNPSLRRRMMERCPVHMLIVGIDRKSFIFDATECFAEGLLD